MRLAQGRAGWALLAAGTVGLAVAAAAPETPGPAPATTTAAARPAAADAPPSAATSQDRLAEIKVELAWLTDMGLFPYQLAARVNGGRLEVGGIVPTDALAQRALQIAREQSKMAVKDKLLIAAGSGVLPVRNSNDNLCRTAVAAMSKAFKRFPGSFEVTADARGVITITGQVPTCEDKLNISRRLSQLSGCTAVVNQLAVAPVTHDGKAFTPVSADGKQEIAGASVALLPNLTPESFPPVPVTPPSTVKAAPGKQPAPVANATAPKTAPAAAPSASRPAQMNTQAAAQPAPKPVAAQAPAKPTTPPATLPPAVASNAAPAKPATTPPAMLPPTVASSAAPVKPTDTAAKAASNSSVVLASATQPAMPVAAPSPPPALPPQAVAKLKQRVESVCGTKAQSLELTARSANTLQLRFKVQSEADGQALGKRVMDLPELSPYQVDLKVEVVKAPMPKAAPPALLPPAVVSTARPVMPVPTAAPKPTTGNGIMQASATQPAAAPKTPALTPQVLAQLKQRVETVCGSRGSKVEVVARGGNSLLLRFAVRNEADGQALGRQIMNLPELAPYQVDLKVEVPQ